jgi:uncharacterized membrane protein (TIGR02234 family)
MRRVHHLLAGSAVLVLLVALGVPWFSFLLPTGATVVLRGLEASALAATLVAAAAASYGASLLMRGFLRRFLGMLQAVMCGGACVSWLMVLQAPCEQATTQIIALTGLEGSQALAGVTIIGPSWGFIAGLLGVSLGALSGLAGVVAADKEEAPSRYRRASEDATHDSVSAWDHLSEGVDPTKR